MSRVFVIFIAHFIHATRHLFDIIARRVNLGSTLKFTRGEVSKSEVHIKVSQFTVTDVRIELLRQKHLTNGGFALVTFISAIQKLKTREVSFSKLRVERLRLIDFFLSSLCPHRLRRLYKSGLHCV